MAKAAVQVVGREGVIANLGKLITGVESNLMKLISQALGKIKRGAVSRSPSDTGEYRKSFKSKNLGMSGWVAPIQKEGGKDRVSRIGHLLEFGTAAHGNHPGTAAKPHLFPAFEEVTQKMGGEIAKALRNVGPFR